MTLSLFLRHLLEFAILIPAAVFALLPVRGWLRIPEKKTWLPALAAVTVSAPAGAALCAGLGLSTRLVLLCFIPLYLLLYFRMLTLAPAKKLFCFFNAAMLCSLCFLFTVYLMTPLELDNESNAMLPLSGLVCLGLSALLFALFFRSLTVKLPDMLGNSLLDGQWRLFLCLPVFLLILDVLMIPRYPVLLMMGRVRRLSLMGFSLLPLGVFFLYHISWKLTQELTENAQLSQENSLLKMEEKRFEELRAHLESSRVLRHDFRKHLLVIRDLNAAGETEKLSAYLAPLLETTDSQVLRLCENRALDAVASHYARQAAAQGIELSWQLELPEALPFREADLCAILGNLLENAIAAVSALPPEQRKIQVRAAMLSKALLGLSVENPYAGEITIGENGLPVSARPGHGVGMRSVASAVRHYGGSLDFSAEDGRCTVGILLNAENS